MGHGSFRGESVPVLGEPDVDGPELLMLNFAKELVAHVPRSAHLVLIGPVRLGINSGQTLDADTGEVIAQLAASHRRSTLHPDSSDTSHAVRRSVVSMATENRTLSGRMSER